MTEVDFAVYAYLNGVWTDITSDVEGDVGLTAVWGILSNSHTDKIAATGKMNFSLKNTTKKYNPDGSSPLSGWKKGTPVKVVFTSNEVEYIRFRGYVDKIAIDPGVKLTRRAHVTALDWLDYAAKYPLEIPAIEEDKTADYAIDAILDAMPIQPQATELDTGLTEFPTIFDSATIRTNAYSEFSKLVNSEVGYAYLKKDATYGETLVFKNFTSRSGVTPLSTVVFEGEEEFLLKEDGDNLLKEDGGGILLNNASEQDVEIDNEFLSIETNYGDNIVNFYTTSAYPKRIGTSTELIYSLEKPLRISPGETINFRIQYTDPSSKRVLAALPPTDDGTVVLLKGEGESFASVITDETGRVWTNPAADVQTIDTEKKYGNGSLYFDGSSSYIYTADSPDFDFGTDDFTIEWWEFRFATTSGMTTVRRNASGGFPAFAIGRSNGTNLLIDMSSAGVSNDIANGKSLGAIDTANWVHYAVCRSGNNFYAFKDGTLTDNWTSSASLRNETADMVIGRNSATYLSGCIDEFRIIKGTAKYTSAFTPPTEGFSLSGNFFTAGTTETGGTDIKSSFTVDIDYGGVGADVSVTNSHTATGYLQELNIYSYIVQSDVPIVNIQQDTPSIESYGYQTADLQMPYQQDTGIGVLEGARVMETEKNPRLTMRKVTMTANRSSALMAYFLNMDVGDLVRLSEDQTEIDSLFWINGVEFRVLPNAIVEFSWYVRDFKSLLLGLSPITVEFDEASTDGLYFGSLPYVDEALRGDYSLSAWVNIDADTAADQYILSMRSGIGGAVFGVDNTGNTAFLWDTMFSGNNGVWKTPAGSITYNSWHHIVATYNSNSSSDPVLYVDGVSVTVTETETPTGTKDTVNTLVVIGNTKSPSENYNRPVDGEVKDVRIYNRILSAAEVTTLYNSGTADASLVTDGLVFQAPCVRTNQLSDYVGGTLTTGMNVLDNVYGIVGFPNGTPTGRAF